MFIVHFFYHSIEKMFLKILLAPLPLGWMLCFRATAEMLQSNLILNLVTFQPVLSWFGIYCWASCFKRKSWSHPCSGAYLLGKGRKRSYSFYLGKPKKPLWSGTQEVSAETFWQLDFDDLTDTIAATPVNAAKLGYETPPPDSFIKYISA